MRSNEQIEVMNWGDKNYHPVVMSPVGLALGEGPSVHAKGSDPSRRLVVIEKRPLFRECLVRCLMNHEAEEIASYASVELFITQLEAVAASDPASEILVVYSVGNQFIDEGMTARLSRILNSGHPVRLVILSEREEASQAASALEHGASGFIPMTMSLKVVSEAIRLVLAGGMYVPASSLLAAHRPHDVRGGSSYSRLSGLTHRQLAVLDAVRRGKANKIIAYELNMCESTVKVHLRNIMKKLRARNRTEAAFMVNEAMQQSDWVG